MKERAEHFNRLQLSARGSLGGHSNGVGQLIQILVGHPEAFPER